MKVKKKNILDIINKYDWAYSLGLLAFMILILRDKIMIFYNEELSIIDNIISIFGTLFGFVLTCLSIFIVFRTDEKYSNDTGTNKKSINLLLSNSKFNDIYMLFLKNLYSLGTILLLSFIIYFLETVCTEIKIIFIIIYMFFINMSVIRTILSLVAFKKLISIIIEKR